MVEDRCRGCNGELAYAAGLFDGEGSIMLRPRRPRNNGTLIVSMSNTDAALIAWMKERWGGFAKPYRMQGNRKPAWSWCLAARAAARFLSAIQPYVVSPRNKQRIRLALDFQASKSLSHAELRSPEYATWVDARLVDMAALNRRGLPSE